MPIGTLAGMGLSWGAKALFKGDSNRGVTQGAIGRAERERLKAQQNLNESRGEFGGAIKKAGQLAGSIHDRGDLSVIDRYSDELQNSQDQLNSAAASSTRAVNRAMMAGGGDISGAGGVQLNQVQQNANSAINQAMSQFSQMNNQANMQDQSRADGLLGMKMRGSANLHGNDQGSVNTANQMLTNAEGQEIDRKMANRQLGVDIASTALENIDPIKSLF